VTGVRQSWSLPGRHLKGPLAPAGPRHLAGGRLAVAAHGRPADDEPAGGSPGQAGGPEGTAGQSPPPGSPAPGRWLTGVRLATGRHWSQPLTRGGLALIINTGLTGALGFVYWIIAARLFSAYAVGLAGSLVAATSLFSGLGQLNLSGMLMRFLPTAGQASRRLVLLTYGFAASASASLAAASLAIIGMVAAPHSPLRLGTAEAAVFVVAVAATAIFTLQDSALVGLRRAVWVPAENGAFGAAKIAILFVLAPVGTAFSLYGAWMIPLALTIPAISAVLFRRFLPQAPKPRWTARLGRDARATMLRFALGDAAGGLFTQAWTYLLPVLITVMLGAPVNALYFTSFLFSSTIDQVAANYASPLTVEGAHSPANVASLTRSALRHIFTITLPIAASIMVVSPWLLRAFGERYVRAVPLLCLLLAACLPRAVSIVYYAYCRIQRATHRSAAMQAGVCVAMLAAAVLLAPPFGLVGVGCAVLAVQTAAGGVSWLALRRGLGNA
jgi:O-antigen/teichoic acid export membrane protein